MVNKKYLNNIILSLECLALIYFFRGGYTIYLVLIFFRYIPEIGASLYVQIGLNYIIYIIFNLNSFFRDWTFRSLKH